MDHLTLNTAIPMIIVENPSNTHQIIRIYVHDNDVYENIYEKKQRRKKFAYK